MFGALGFNISGIFLTIETTLWCNFYCNLSAKQSIGIMKPNQGFVPKYNSRSARWDLGPSHFLTPCLSRSLFRCTFCSKSVSQQVKQIVDSKALNSSCSWSFSLKTFCCNSVFLAVLFSFALILVLVLLLIHLLFHHPCTPPCVLVLTYQDPTHAPALLLFPVLLM